MLGGAAAVAAAPLAEVQAREHNIVNGPFPPKSWACAPPAQVPAQLHDQERARAQLRLLRDKEQVKEVKLTLIHPDDDPRVAGACKDIALQLAAVGEGAGCPLRIEPKGLPPAAFRKAIDQRDYELAYCHLDHDSEAYWLWPLFDGRPEALQPGGANFLGCEDATLEGKFRAAMGRREVGR